MKQEGLGHSAQVLDWGKGFLRVRLWRPNLQHHLLKKVFYTLINPCF